MLVTNEDQIPIVEIDDSHTSSITQDFLWFMKVHWVLISISFPIFAPGLMHINFRNFSWGVSHDQSFGMGVNYLSEPLQPQYARCHFLLKAKAVSPLRFQSKEACIPSDCVSNVQSYGIIWQRLKCRSDCFISIQIFFQLDRDQKVVSCVSENGEENKYQGGSGFLLPPPFALMPQPKSFSGWDADLTSWLLLQLSCMWEDIRWLRQSVPISMSSSTVLQTRQKMLAATAQLQVRRQAGALESVFKLETLTHQSYWKGEGGRGLSFFRSLATGRLLGQAGPMVGFGLES